MSRRLSLFVLGSRFGRRFPAVRKAFHRPDPIPRTKDDDEDEYDEEGRAPNYLAAVPTSSLKERAALRAAA